MPVIRLVGPGAWSKTAQLTGPDGDHIDVVAESSDSTPIENSSFCVIT